MKTGAKLALFLVMLFLPLAARGVWHYRGVYRPAQPGAATLQPPVFPATERTVYSDQPAAGDGRVLVDTAHANILDVDDLTPLKERLAARGTIVELYDGLSSSLEDMLRPASAFISAAPSTDFSADERIALGSFVRSGGRLLLATDPTRFTSSDPFSGIAPQSTYAAVNSLANAFGLVFYEDYLYNQVENAGNYRVVRFHNFTAGEPLVEGLESLVLPAASSIQSQGEALLVGDENTRSNLRQSSEALSPAVLGADGLVLALGDLTFLTPQFHTLGDNDHFLSNIADWLAQDTRQRGITDFPFMFKGPVDLVQLLDDTVDPYLVASSSPLLNLFEQENIPIALKEKTEAGAEAIYLGVFDRLDDVQDFLDSAGVTIQIPEPDAGAEVSVEASASGASGEVSVEGMGVFLAQGSGLIIVDRSQAAVRLVVLAEDRDSLLEVVDRLVFQNLDGCASQGDVTLCPTGEAAYGFNSQSQGESGGGIGASILIVSVDNGNEGVRTGMEELSSILGESYQVATWSLSTDGLPASEDLSGYDAVIVNSGDYAFPDGDLGGLDALFGIESPVMYLGEQPLPPTAFAEPPAVLLDMQVAEASHPLVAGFDASAVITLEPSESGVPALVLDAGEVAGDPQSDTSVVFVRGPESPSSGSPVLVASVENGRPTIVALFSLYRLPADLQRIFTQNAAAWLLGG